MPIPYLCAINKTVMAHKGHTHDCSCHSHGCGGHSCGRGTPAHTDEPHALCSLKNLPPAVSFLLLISGIVMTHFGMAWFSAPLWQATWYAAAYLPVGIPVIREAWEACCRKDFFNEFSLMALASIGAFCIGEYPEGVAVMLFYTLGEMMQDRAVDSASRHINELLDVRPTHTHVFRNGDYADVAPDSIQPGELIEIRPGERVALDGLLQEEQATFDTSALTGESLPRTLQKGDEVLAGMIACEQAIHIQVSRPYEDSTLSRILTMVRNASERKAPAEVFIHRFARIYTPIVVVSALLLVTVPALIGWLTPSRYVFTDWLYRGLVFLVISCPCALVISIPLAYFAGIGAASRSGILFKGGNYLYAITQVNHVAFDKTGTLTTGRFGVSEVLHENISEAELLGIMLAAERKSTHPIAQAIVRHAVSCQTQELPLTELKEVTGFGMEAVINGKSVYVGNLKLLEKQGVQVPEYLRESVSTIVACAIDGHYVGAVLLADALKEDAPSAIARLKRMGIAHIHLLSGDKKEIVAQYAQELGISQAHGGLLPQDKAEYIERLTATSGNTVAFVGDGMNDAPVLALSHVGIAMGGIGSDAAVESADVVIQTDQPSKVATAIAVGRATRRIVIQNIAGALGVKAVVLGLGAAGITTLWAAVFADVGVALLAVLNSIRILYRKF